LPEIKNAQVHEEKAEKPDLHRLAKLCSVGAIPIPGDLTQAEQQQLLLLIAESRKKRLLNFFAAVIAEDILREQHQ